MLALLTWGVDLFIRSIVMARTRYPREAHLKIISDNVLEVSFPKTAFFAYNPGQYIYLSVPEISWLQWHPFSMSSAPKQQLVTLHIRKAGKWTQALFELAKSKENVVIAMEGPYGSISVDISCDRKYKNIMLISGGIGSKFPRKCSPIVYPVWSLSHSSIYLMKLPQCSPFVTNFCMKRQKIVEFYIG
jgi:predicted ferric reductase